MFNYSTKVIIKKDQVNKAGEAPLYLQSFINKKRSRINLNVRCKIADFDTQKQQIKGRSKAVKSKNAILFKYKSKAEDLFYHSIMTENVLTKATFESYIKNDAIRKDFLTFMKVEIEKQKGLVVSSMISHYKRTVKKIETKWETIPFNSLTVDFLQEFDKVLINQGLEVNTRWTHHKDLRKFINIAIKNGIDIKNPYDNYKVAKAKTEPVFLSVDELQKFIKLYDDGVCPEHWQRVLRQFLFMCGTGLRISEMKILKDEDIIENTLMIRPPKTQKFKMIHTVPLSNFAKKYLPEGRGVLFDTYKYDQTFNKYIKRIGEHLEIKKNVTAHVARHTFATTFLELGGAVEVLNKILGHADLTTTMIYVHVTNKRKSEQVNNFDEFLT